jgi:molybdenum cofactor guanylyltransferase
MVPPSPPTAGLILAGGQSRRMDRDKATLDWHGRPLLRHVVDQLASLSPLIVLAGPEQQLPELPLAVKISRDPLPFQGPLVALRNGLSELNSSDAAFVTGCDYPFVSSAVVNFLAERLGEYDAVVPRVQSQAHPLLGFYRLPLLPTVQRLLDQGVRSLHALLDVLDVRWVKDEECSSFDPSMSVLTNLNTPGEYAQAHRAFPEERKNHLR